MIKIAAVCLGLLLSFHIAACAEQSDAVDFLYEIGKHYYEQGDYDQALHELKKALMVDPGHQEAQALIEVIEEELLTPAEIEQEVAREEAMIRALEQAEGKFFEEPFEEPVEQEPLPEPVAVEEEEAQEEEEAEAADEPYQLIKPGKTFVELFTKYYWHNTEFDSGGKRKRWAYNGRYREVRTEVKIEHGLTEDLTLLASIPYKIALWKDDFNRNTTNGIGDIWMRLKYRAWEQLAMPFTFYVQPGLRAPTGYDQTNVPALGGGDIATELRFLGVRSFSGLPAYAKIETGYRYRSDDLTDEIPYFFELGWHPTDWFLFKTTIDGIEGLQGTGGDEEDWTKWTVHTIFSPKGGFGTFRKEDIFNIELGYGNTFDGKNTGNGTEVILNITYQF
jgi:tetratricopeptide (TPR) repeat protein